MRKLTAVLATLALLVLASCGEDGAGVAADDCEEGVVETDSGLRYEELECGSGDQAGRGDVVIVEYSVAIEGEEPFDSGTLPPVQVGAGSVVPGFDEGLVGMRVGGRRRLIVPPELGYGPEGDPPTIPPDTTLVFEVELLELQSD